MKKILSLVFAVIAIGHVSANEIDPSSPVGISVVKNGNIVKLFYRGEQTGNVKVVILNEKGRMVFSEIMREREHFMRPYNFESLPKGNYTLEITDAQGTRTRAVKHALTSQKRSAHLSRVNNDDSRYVLMVPNKGHDELTVKIYNDQNRLVYEGTEIIDGNFAKVYNLSKIAGEPTFEIMDQDGKRNRLSKRNRRNRF